MLLNILQCTAQLLRKKKKKELIRLKMVVALLLRDPVLQLLKLSKMFKLHNHLFPSFLVKDLAFCNLYLSTHLSVPRLNLLPKYGYLVSR